MLNLKNIEEQKISRTLGYYDMAKYKVKEEREETYVKGIENIFNKNHRNLYQLKEQVQKKNKRIIGNIKFKGPEQKFNIKHKKKIITLNLRKQGQVTLKGKLIRIIPSFSGRLEESEVPRKTFYKDKESQDTSTDYNTQKTTKNRWRKVNFVD